MMLLDKGGIMIWPILGFSILILAVILDRLLAMTAFRMISQSVLNRVKKLVAEGRDSEARGLLENEGPGSSAVFLAVLSVTGKTKREQAASRAGETLLFRLGRRLPVLSAGAAAAPLMGLLGTVLGMIDVFSRVSTAPGGVDIALLADGIWQALLTTAAGLGVAIPALLAYHFLTRFQDRIGFRMQHESQDFVDDLEEMGR
ncbi:MotA/TolQ/ExbB proton channel family protein [Desulfoplanes sp.]